MSFRALVIPEDPTYNGYILGPLVDRMLLECGKPRARVEVLKNPKVGGYSTAKDAIRDIILDSYAMVDLMLFLPDRDGEPREGELLRIEADAQAKGRTLFCCAAVEEVETWLLACHADKLDKPWNDVRADSSVKETTFAGFLAAHGNTRAVGQGRLALMMQGLTNYKALLQRCPELADLQQRICDRLAQP